MKASFTEDQEMIRDTAHSFLTDWKSAGGCRQLTDAKLPSDAKAWAALAGELGFAGLMIPEAHGGAGLGDIERALVMEEMGRVLFMAPYFSTCVLASDLLIEAGGESAEKLLEQIASGTRTCAVAHLPASALSTGKLTGTAPMVVDGAEADDVLIVCADGLYHVSGDAEGLTRSHQTTLDLTRARARLEFTSVEVDCLSKKLDHEAARARSAVALAAEQVGGADAMLTETVAYSLERKQFGRQIGSFQAVKHRCADMMIAVETARSAVYLGAAMAGEGRDALIEHAAIAKSEASEAYFKVAGDAIQMHGGVGVTWEYDLHFHFKRAQSGKRLLGSPEHWRETLAGKIGLNGGAA